MTRILLLSVALGFWMIPLVAAQDHTQHSEHVGKENRVIKSLSDDRVEALMTGAGAGYALPAELNHYPGPTHVLELKNDLALTPAQESSISDIFVAMSKRAKELGHKLLEIEKDLDEAFQNRSLTGDRLEELTSAASSVDGALRFVHLNAHVHTRALLSEEQIDRYDELRGYSFDGTP